MIVPTCNSYCHQILTIRMADELRFTLVGDGPFDQALLPIVDWVLHASGVTAAIQGEWADVDRLPRQALGLSARIVSAFALYPCELIFVHRDAESSDHMPRIDEIEDAVRAARNFSSIPSHVGVIPVRMTEAWLLFDRRLIREAAGNPKGTQALTIPRPWDRITDPNQVLHDALRTASGLNARRRARFNTQSAAYRVSQLAKDFSALRALETFRLLESDAQDALHALHLI